MTTERRLSLQTQLLLAVGVLALASVTAVAVASRYGARLEFHRFEEIERRAESDRLETLTTALARQLNGRCCAAGQLDAARAQLGSDDAVLVVDGATGQLVGSAGTPIEALRDITTTRTGAQLAIEASRVHDGLVDRLALKFQRGGAAMRLGDGRAALLYILPFPDPSREQRTAALLGSLDRRLLVVTGLVAVAALIATWLVARRTVRPIDELRAATRDLAAGRLDRRVEPAGGREVADLGRSFNAMADELEHQQALRRNLVTDVAHELRTPLTALQCRVETVQDGLAPDPAQALRQAHEELLHLGRLVDDLQELALAEARELTLDVREVRIGDVVASAVRAAGLEHDRRLQMDEPSGLPARCDGMRTRQMLLNLLTNADRYTPADGRIVIRIRQQGADTVVEVTNSGSRLEAAEIDRLFDRFYRTDPSRQRVTGGTGLGLAIVKHLAEAQGGRVFATRHEDSVTVGFSLPA